MLGFNFVIKALRFLGDVFEIRSWKGLVFRLFEIGGAVTVILGVMSWMVENIPTSSLIMIGAGSFFLLLALVPHIPRFGVATAAETRPSNAPLKRTPQEQYEVVLGNRPKDWIKASENLLNRTPTVPNWLIPLAPKVRGTDKLKKDIELSFPPDKDYFKKLSSNQRNMFIGLIEWRGGYQNGDDYLLKLRSAWQEDYSRDSFELWKSHWHFD